MNRPANDNAPAPHFATWEERVAYGHKHSVSADLLFPLRTLEAVRRDRGQK